MSRRRASQVRVFEEPVVSFTGKLPSDRLKEIWGAIILAISVFIFLALATDGYQGENRRLFSQLADIPNTMGPAGAVLAGFLYILLGMSAHFTYSITCVWGVMLMCHRPLDRMPARLVGFFLLLSSVAGLLHLHLGSSANREYPGGVIGAFAAGLINPTFGMIGATVIAATFAIIGVLLATEFLFVRLVYGGLSALGLTIHSVGDMRYHLGKVRKKKLERDKAHRLHREEIDSRYAPAIDEVAPSLSEDLSRIRVRPKPVVKTEALPFDEVPPVDSLDDPAHVIEKLRDQNDSDFIAATQGEIQWVEEEEEEEKPVAQAAASVLTPQSKEKKPKAMRRRTIDEELPADYKYPKRYKKPPIDLLEEASVVEHHDLSDSLRKTGVLLEETLQTFGIDARVTDITRGPTITRFELEPAPGVKVSRFMALADDLALALKAHRVRVEAPIPGKGKVGIEVPNDDREDVVIRELLESREFRRHSGKLTLALGKDITGDVTLTDLAAMPHLLVAGATGAGKTVCIKTILASLLYSKTPDELQLMLIDPKMVELSIFNDIPHLITPVVIDPKKAATSLTWLINEMEERYRLFAHLRVRNIEVYNLSVENGEIEMADGDGGDTESLSIIRKLPYIVCIIDELADLMMLARAEVEDAIARLAQLARAVGIHLIIATQRPSVDVLTGVIKANFPARISFQVSSRVDSRCILDEIGAERLIGMGDMLYLPAGQSKPARIQGAFVSDEEMNALIAYLKTQAPPQYRHEIEEFGKTQGALDDIDNDSDELLDDAIRVVVETGQASISMVQRRLRVGYTRAARLIDMMERRGIVGPHIGSKAREILVSASNKDSEAM